MDTGTGRFRHWAQCAVVVIVQRKKVVLKTAKNSKPFQIEAISIFSISKKQSMDLNLKSRISVKLGLAFLHQPA